MLAFTAQVPGPLDSTLRPGSRPATPAGEDEALTAARANLRRAMHSRKIADLGESAQLYKEELEQGRRALEMERKTAVRARLKEAERARDVERWYAAVRDGQAVGLSAAVLKDTMRELSAEQNRIAARTRICQASRPSAAAADLRAALAEGEKVGLSDEELSHGRWVLAGMEEKLDAQRAMNEAAERRDLGALQSTLERGVALRLQGSSPFLGAERALQDERERIASRLDLKDACLRKSWTLQSQIEDLRTAVERGEAAGLADPELDRARGTLAADERTNHAREKLQEAAESQRLEDLEQAIELGEAAGLDPSELALARRLKIDAYKPAAREKLKDAVASCDIEALLAAIRYGEEVGITKLGLQEAVDTLAAEERKVRARANLREVGPGREIPKLFTAIRFGEGVGLTEPELEPYRRILAEERRKAAAREACATAAAGGTSAPLYAAVAEGEAAGLQAAELVAARAALAEALESESVEALERALRIPTIPELQAAVATAESGIPDIDVIFAHLDRTPNHPELDAQLAKVKELLASEVRKAKAREWCKEAERRRDLEDLRAAVREGEAVGLTYLEIRGAQAALAEEELRVPALRRLREAVQCRDVETLRGAITQGDKAKLTRAELRQAREVLAVEERRASARAGLQRAERNPSIQGLEAALAEGRAAGLGHEELEVFEAALAAERRSAARIKLAEAERSRSIPDLQRAVRQAERVGLEPADVAAARGALAEERLRSAVGSDAVNTLRTAISEGERRAPTSQQLTPARESLTGAQRREAARQALQDAEETSDTMALMSAIRRGRKEGLEEWELEGAARLLDNLRRVLSSKDEGVRKVMHTPAEDLGALPG
eukprot:CAMPEP_0175636844 /NCGR_PEP_ID=MMETSP0097-20121207/2409_1 /TAXON_ID=311494 /ORGANISM="Alexandrium monilatum, Strain CCMP3105" /LENGTH=847 /DNA_ID=CAMNT_0016942511 /DNA_START=137 /DNA_END=2677 /DNA_ORIENTATION=+